MIHSYLLFSPDFHHQPWEKHPICTDWHCWMTCEWRLMPSPPEHIKFSGLLGWTIRWRAKTAAFRRAFCKKLSSTMSCPVLDYIRCLVWINSAEILLTSIKVAEYCAINVQLHQCALIVPKLSGGTSVKAQGNHWIFFPWKLKSRWSVTEARHISNLCIIMRIKKGIELGLCRCGLGASFYSSVQPQDNPGTARRTLLRCFG